MSTNPPTIAMKPASSKNPDAIAIHTSKEWVLPPRPKPGRKADSDNAPTKRKAQNRVAQRAFRERRAARVGELEQQIRDIEAAHRLELEAVEVDNGRLKLENVKLRDAMDGLMRELNTIKSLTKLSQSPGHSMQTPNPTPNSSLPAISSYQMASPAASNEVDAATNMGSVTPALSPLQSITNSGAYLGESVPLRRKGFRSSNAVHASKRQRLSPEESKSEFLSYGSEYAFGASAFKPPAGESCGFCSDGTPCLCAEAAQQHALAEEYHRAGNKDHCSNCAQELPCLCSAVAKASTHAGLMDTSQNIDRPVTLVKDDDGADEDNGICTGNPGSCRQCQLDPMSSLFCRTLAGTTAESSNTEPLRRPALLQQMSTFSVSSARDSTPPMSDSNGAEFLACSAAYRTLSTHKNFKDNNMATIVKSLDVDRAAGRGVQVSSVRDMLKVLDRGLGRG